VFRAQPPLGPVFCVSCAAECDLAAVASYRAIAKDTNTRGPLVVLCSECTARRTAWVIEESRSHPFVPPS
jgi:hypothetical protein